MKEGEEMAKMLMYASRALMVAMCFVVLGVGSAANAQPKPAGQNPPAKKKKLPPGAKGFEQFADRDASDKLVTGGATRGNCASYQELLDCANTQYGQGNIKDAVEFFTRASAMKPEMFKPQYHLGQIYEEQGNYKEAIAAYKRAVTLKTDESMGETVEFIAYPYYNLANIYAKMNDHDQAIATYREVVNRLPNAPMTYYNIGLSQAALGKDKEAIASFKEAISRKEDYWEAYYNLGIAHSKLEEYPQAVEAFKKTLEFNQDYAQARYNLGLVYYFMDDNKSLAAEMKTLQKMKPELAKELAKLTTQ
jgi:tetratricopeptide (TPR) repeat protein